MQAINFITQRALTQPLKNVVWARLLTQQEFQIANMYSPLYYVVDDGKLEGFWCDIERIKCRKNSEKCQKCFFTLDHKRVHESFTKNVLRNCSKNLHQKPKMSFHTYWMFIPWSTRGMYNYKCWGFFALIPDEFQFSWNGFSLCTFLLLLVASYFGVFSHYLALFQESIL